MNRVIVTLLFLIAGCDAAGVPAAGPDPMTIVWEHTYGMETAARPSVIWHDECRTDDDGAGQYRSVTVGHGCVQVIVFDDGRIELQRTTLVSKSRFSLALEQWKQYLLTSSFGESGSEIAAANQALTDAGY